MNERVTRKTENDSPFALLGTMFMALTDALNLRYLREELYESVDLAPGSIDVAATPRPTEGSMRSIPPSRAADAGTTLSDHLVPLQAAPFDRGARRRGR